jgi:hypothetical protein
LEKSGHKYKKSIYVRAEEVGKRCYKITLPGEERVDTNRRLVDGVIVCVLVYGIYVFFHYTSVISIGRKLMCLNQISGFPVPDSLEPSGR